MDELLASLLSAAVLVFAVASMLSVGLAYSIREILGPLRSVRRVALVLVANFVLVPTWALLLTWVFGLAEPYAIGLVVVACAAGAPFLVKLVTTADGDVAIAASLLILLLPVTVVYMPLVVPLIAPDADVSAGAIATPLVLTNLLPLAVGMVVLARLPKVAERLRPPLGPVSTVALVALLVLTVAAYWDQITAVFGEWVILATTLLVAGAFGIGFGLGASDHHKDEIGLATAQRNVAAATVAATTAIGHPGTVVTVVVASIVSMVLLFPLAWQLNKSSGQSARAERRTT
jgi:BASS family bile acid:Na+ symporter